MTPKIHSFLIRYDNFNKLLASIAIAVCFVIVGCSTAPQGNTTPSVSTTRQNEQKLCRPVTPPPAMPDESRRKCGACHAIDHKVVGPSWVEVATKYNCDPDAASKIAANIIKGGTFGYNTGISMPPRGNSNWDDAQIKSVSEFIAGIVNMQ